MKIQMKIAVLAVLCVTAVVMTVGAVKSIAAPEKENNPPEIISNASAENKNAEYYLRDCSGYVAVFKGANSSTPIELIDSLISSFSFEHSFLNLLSLSLYDL